MSIKSVVLSAPAKASAVVTGLYVLGTSTIYAADSATATAAQGVLDTAQADVGSTSPKVMMVVGGVVVVGILVALLRKAH